MEQRILEHVDGLLDLLQSGASPRTKRSLEIVHLVCKEQADRGSLDFSVAMIGDLSGKAGGPKTQSIRNKEGKPYRDLIGAWDKSVNSTEKTTVRKNYSDRDKNLLAQIDDPTIKACVGIALSELRKLRGENNILKQAANVIIDQRPHGAPVSDDFIRPSKYNCKLNNVEWSALEHAVSDDLFKKMGWQAEEKNGSVSREGRPIYRAGYLIAIKKILLLYK